MKLPLPLSLRSSVSLFLSPGKELIHSVGGSDLKQEHKKWSKSMLTTVRICPVLAGSTVQWIVHAFTNEAFHEDISSHGMIFLSVEVCSLLNGIRYGKKTCLRNLISFLIFLLNSWNTNFIHSFIHSSMALQLSVGPWPLLQFHNLFYIVGRTPWRSDQPVLRSLPTHTGQHKHRINAYSHPWLECDLNPWSQCSSERRGFMLLDLAATVIGRKFSYPIKRKTEAVTLVNSF
jgi:hypothetical protein